MIENLVFIWNSKWIWFLRWNFTTERVIPLQELLPGVRPEKRTRRDVRKRGANVANIWARKIWRPMIPVRGPEFKSLDLGIYSSYLDCSPWIRFRQSLEFIYSCANMILVRIFLS